MADPPASLAVADLSVHFGGVIALQGVDLTVNPREIVGIIGPNGAGKTTLFNAICRLVTPASGTIVYAGRSLLGLRASRLAGMGIARTLQSIGLWPRLTVLQNVMCGSQRRSPLFTDLLALPVADRDESGCAAEAMAILAELDVSDRAGAYPSALPHGVQKRVIVARALMSHPLLLLLDEPASGLAASEVDQLIVLLRGLRERMSVALVEHHLDMVMAVSDRVTVLNLGRVIASGTPADIRANADVATAYLGQQVARA